MAAAIAPSAHVLDSGRAVPLVHPKYRPDIDGLRAVAVLAVLVYHAFPTLLPSGFIGVDIFFVISGYLISTIILENLRAGRFTFTEFYARRIRRIFPALALVLVVTFVVGWNTLYAEEFRRLGKHVAAGAAFLSNIFFWREADYFDPEAVTKPLLHLWSLGIEEQFYLAWPLLLWAASRRSISPRTLIVTLAMVSFALNLWTIGRSPTAAFYAPQTRFWELLVGAYLAASPPIARYGNLRAMAGSLLLVVAFVAIDDGRLFPGAWAVLPVVGTALLVSAGPAAWLNRGLLSRRSLVAIGLVSFPLYLWHWPILSFLTIVVGGQPTIAVRIGALVAAFVLAWLTFRFVERPIRGHGGRSVALGLTIAMTALLVAGLATYARFGFVDRPVNAPFAQLELEDYFQSRKPDASCRERLQRTLVDEEVCLTNSAQPTVLFVGDSHAMALYSAIHVGRVDAASALVAGHSCAPYPDLVYQPTYRRAWGNNCTAIAREAVALAASQPSIKTVVIASKPPVFDDAPPSHFMRAPGTAPLDEGTAFDEGTGRLVDALVRQGKSVVFMIAVPEFDRQPTACEPRVRFVEPPVCTFDEKQLAEQRRTYRAHVAALQARFPTMRVFDPERLVCRGGTCSAKHDARYLYQDEQHLSIEGSRVLLQALRNARLLP